MLLATRRVYTGKVVRLDVDTVRFPDGSTGELELIRHPGAAAVIPCASDPAGGDPIILMIKQFRHAADGPMWEIPAGTLAPDEAPEACAHRELHEETGVVAERIERLTSIYTTPGFTDERIHLFLAQGLSAGRQDREADEFLELKEVRWREVLELIRRGEISDGKTLSSLMFVECFRRR